MFKGLIKVFIFFSIIYYFFGAKATYIGLVVYLCLPFVLLSGTVRRCILFMHKVRTPFLDLTNVSSFGIKGGRSFTLKHHSTIDNQEVKLRVWHILPHSLLEGLNSLDDDPDERNGFFEDQLKYSRKPVIVYSHGITQTVGESSRVALYKKLQNLDVHVITFDYRGYGDSTDIMPKRMSVVEDFLVVYSWVSKRCGSSPVFVWGHSLGTGVTNKALSKLEHFSSSLLRQNWSPPLPRGIILESGYNQIATIAQQFGALDWILFLPHCNRIAKHYFDIDPNVRLNSEKYVTLLKNVPYLIMHARNDDIIPLRIGEKLYEAVKYSRTENDAHVWFEVFSNGRHMWLCNEKNFPRIVKDFIDLYKIL